MHHVSRITQKDRCIFASVLLSAICYFLFSEDFQNIIVHNYYHQHHKCHQPCKMNPALNFSIDRFLPNCLNDQKNKSSAIQCRKRKQIHNTKVCRQQYCHIQHVHPEHQSTFTLTFFISCTNRIYDTYRAAEILESKLSRNQFFQTQQSRPDHIFYFQCTVFQYLSE